MAGLGLRSVRIVSEPDRGGICRTPRWGDGLRLRTSKGEVTLTHETITQWPAGLGDRLIQLLSLDDKT